MGGFRNSEMRKLHLRLSVIDRPGDIYSIAPETETGGQWRSPNKGPCSKPYKVHRATRAAR